MTTDNINMLMRSLFINISSFIIFFIITNYKSFNKIQKTKIVLSIILLVFAEVLLKNKTNFVTTIISIILIETILLKSITKIKISKVIISVIISLAVSNLIFIVSGTIEFFVQSLFRINNKIINFLITFVIHFIIIFLITKIKRIKNGLSFLKKENEFIEIAIINISAILIIAYILIGYKYEPLVQNVYFCYIVLGLFLILIVQKTIVMYYKQKLIDDTINQYEKDIQEKDAEIKRLTNENYKISKTNHEFYNRQKALEHMVKKSVENYNIEAGKELEILDRINDLTVEHSEKMNENRNLPKLDLTDIPEIDDMFKYMQNECEKNNIQFKLKVEGNIHILVNNYISTSRLVTLIGDHIRDAIIAINFSPEETNKSIFVILGVKENCYELCIYDTGIEFEIDTLLKLGINPVTTHKKFGGSGIGFMTTFETLKECKASLIIEEKNSKPNNNYTKAIIIRFDGNNEYKIYTYRAKEIIKINNRADLCITEKNT